MSAAEPGARIARARRAIDESDLARRHGYVSNLIGLIIEVTGLQAEIGEVCLVEGGRGEDGRPAVPAEVVGFREGRTLLMPLGELHGIGPGTRVLASGAPFRIAVGDELLGRIVDGLGRPDDGRPAPRGRRPRRSRRHRSRSRAPGSASGSGSVCARSTRSCHAGAASASASSPARASASPRCWA